MSSIMMTCGAHDFGDGFVGGVVGVVASNEPSEVLKAEPGDFVAGINCGLSKRFKEMGFAGGEPGGVAYVRQPQGA